MIAYDRICYEKGNPKNDKIYEFYAFCDCEYCKNRYKYKMGMRNQATAQTKDPSKIKKLKEFLNNWVCKSTVEKERVEYFNF